jgi:uncharacterized integral membrane protein
MKKAKWIFFLLIIGAVTLVVLQNKGIFLNRLKFNIDLFFVKYSAPEFENGLLVLGSFLAGFLISYFFSLAERFKAGRIIRNLNANVRSNQETISTLKQEVEEIKTAATAVPPESEADTPPES